jgi:ADP-heptose:LPS heptosyltransferase
MTRLDLPERPRILVVTLRRLGDVLLTTPLIRTIRRGFPQATLDVLVFRGSERILKGNPDIDVVMTMPERPSAAETLALVGRLWRRYDLVVSTQAGDRPTFYALVAGRRRVGLVPPAGETGAWWKRHVHHIAVTPAPDSHSTVTSAGPMPAGTASPAGWPSAGSRSWRPKGATRPNGPIWTACGAPPTRR